MALGSGSPGLMTLPGEVVGLPGSEFSGSGGGMGVSMGAAGGLASSSLMSRSCSTAEWFWFMSVMGLMTFLPAIWPTDG